jgi:fimbrial isopeptide formation D2 family protein/uncharacterized repeat protein (TIGR02543 family)
MVDPDELAAINAGDVGDVLPLTFTYEDENGDTVSVTVNVTIKEHGGPDITNPDPNNTHIGANDFFKGADEADYTVEDAIGFAKVVITDKDGNPVTPTTDNVTVDPDELAAINAGDVGDVLPLTFTYEDENGDTVSVTVNVTIKAAQTPPITPTTTPVAPITSFMKTHDGGAATLADKDSTATYHVKATLPSNLAGYNSVKITDNVPSSLTVVSVSGAPAGVTHPTYSGNAVSWSLSKVDLSTIGAGKTVDLTITVKVASGFTSDAQTNVMNAASLYITTDPYYSATDPADATDGGLKIDLTDKDEVKTYTVIFKDYDGSVIKTQKVEYGKDATAPKDPTRAGYTFTGWDKSFTNVTKNLTVNAKYTIKKYTVTFKDYDGSVIKAQTVSYGGDATAPKSPTRSGYTFTGWSKSSSAWHNVKTNVTVTAKYEKNAAPVTPTKPVTPATPATPATPVTPVTPATPPAEDNNYTITFVDEDGTVLQTERVKEGENSTPPGEPEKYGYAFIGWDRGEDAWTNVHADAIIKATYVEDVNDEKIDTVTTPLASKSFIERAREQDIPIIIGAPLVAPKGEDGRLLSAWALLNLIIVVIGAALTLIFAIIRKRREDKDQSAESEYNDDRRSKRGVMWIVIMGVLAVIGAIVFILTEDMTKPIVWVDRWTILNAIILLAGIIVGFIGIRRRKQRKEDANFN